MSQTPSHPSAMHAAHYHGAMQMQQQTPHQMMLAQHMNPALHQLAGQSQELIMMQQQTRQNSGHQDSQRPKEPKERLPSVYVGNLPKDYYQLDLYKHVKQLGYNVYQAVINVDKQTKRQNRYGFLQFFAADEARRCATEMNNTKIGANYIRCNLQEGNFMEPKANLLVRYIDLGVTQQQFYEAFSTFGPIRSCKLELYPDGKSRGFGYIQFENEAAAAAAIAQSQILEFNGKKVEVLPHQRREQRPAGERSFLNIFVQGLPPGTDDDSLKAMFDEFGEIQSAHVQRGGKTREDLTNKGYVSFKEGESAQRAIDVMHKKQMDDTNYLLVSQHISKRENEVAAQSQNSATIQSSMRKTFESNLFVKNIPAEIKEEELSALFEEIGPVISIKLRQGKYFNPNAAYRQYFILYKDIECAKKAIQRFDQSTPFGARALSVQFWMPTNELHQEREQRSFQEVQQYFMKNLYNSQASQFTGPGGLGSPPVMQGDRPPMNQGNNFRQGNFQGGQRGGNFQQRDNRQVSAGGERGKFNNSRGGNRDGSRAFQQRGNRDGYGGNQQPGVAQMTPDQALLLQQQQQMMQQQLPPVDINRLNSLDPAEKRQEIGNTIYQFIQSQYGDAAGKITGMLLDNDRIVDSIQLVTSIQYLQQKAHEAFTLLQQQPDQAALAAQQHMISQ